MNLINKNRLLFRIFLVMVVINLAALISFFLFTRPAKEESGCRSDTQQCGMFTEELNLTKEQTLQVDAINIRYKEFAGPLSARVKETRAAILTELEKPAADTGIIDSLIGELAQIQTQIQKANVKQYLQLKEICNPDQALKLSSLYHDLYNCPGKGQGQHRNRNGRGCPQGINGK